MTDEAKPKGQDLTLQPLQLAALLVIDAQIAQLQLAANQLGGFLKLKREGDILVRALQGLVKERETLMNDWSRTVQVVQALPPQINGIIQGK